MKLTDFIKITPESSNIDVPCEATPGHHSKKFVYLHFDRVVTVDGVPKTVTVGLRACPACFDMFVYDCSKVAKELHGR